MSTEHVILVVGDDPQGHSEIMRSLDRLPYRVLGADSPDDAMRHIHDDVELVISDLQPSHFNGLALLREWKSRQPRTKFILITDGHDVSAAVEAMKLGAADCLVTPVDHEELRNLVVRILRNSNGNGAKDVSDDIESEGQYNIEIPPGTSLEDLERAAVEQALAQHQGNRTHAAKTLGISVRTLQRKLKAWGIPVGTTQHHASHHHFMISSPIGHSSYTNAH
jgi:DNA-binding NtrC family response regulator